MSDGYADQQMTDYEENLDWDSVGNPPNKGQYNFLVEKAEHAFSRNGGKHMIKCVLKIEGYDPKEPGNEKFIGRTVFVNLNFSQQGAFLTKELLNVLGIDKPTTINKGILEELANLITGQQVGGVIDHRTFNDQLQANLKKFVPLMDVNPEIEVEDNAGMDEGTGEQEEVEAAPEEEEEQPPQPPPQPERRSLRAAQAAGAPQIQIGNTKNKATNGHTNGHTNGTAKTAPASGGTKKKEQPKTSARR